ncbi:hypothetical protein D3C71_1674760 [compost metagenome]
MFLGCLAIDFHDTLADVGRSNLAGGDVVDQGVQVTLDVGQITFQVSNGFLQDGAFVFGGDTNISQHLLQATVGQELVSVGTDRDCSDTTNNDLQRHGVFLRD